MRQPTYEEVLAEEYRFIIEAERKCKCVYIGATMIQSERKYILDQVLAWLQANRIGVNSMGVIIALERLGYLKDFDDIVEIAHPPEVEAHPV